MKPLQILALAAFLPLSALAETPAPEGPGPVEAHGLTLTQFLWAKRPVVVFADTEADPNFIRQMEMIAARLDFLDERDVIVIFDTSPDDPSEIRRTLHPRGFSLVILDKDGQVKLRKPLPWDVREIGRAIDKFPLRRDELLERNPAGR
ncbi:Methylmalonyl-CoA epimerase [Rhodobacter sp. AKP1]|nr:Methylmalonyl-CoA epimerase [Rhodobacter sp. AKP1]